MESGKYGWYSTASVDLSEILQKKSSEISFAFDQENKGYYERLVRIMDNTYRLSSHHVWMLSNPHLAQVHRYSKVIFSAIGKNFFVLHGALQLTRQGLYGPARTLLRHVFEYLVVAKYCAVSLEARVFDRWDAGDTVYFTNGVLKKIVKPDTKELKDFWALMCQYSHSTNVSQQVVLEWDGSEDDIFVTLCFIRALLECQYHLLNSHLITASMRAFALRYDDEDEIRPLREENKELLKVTRPLMGKKARALTKCYTSAWHVAP